MHDLSAPDVHQLSARGRVYVAAPPISPMFHPCDQGAARDSLGLRSGAFVVLVTTGAWGVGTSDAAVALLELGERIQVVAVCGHNRALRRSLEALGQPRSRLVPLGFVGIMPELMAAADVVVTNAGGVTSLEAFASARPVLLFDPIAGHGRANAAMMEQAGLALVCHGIPELRSTIAELIADEGRVARMRAAELAHLEGRNLGDDLALLAAAEPLPLPPGRGMRLAVRSLIASAALTALLFHGSWTADRDLARLARPGCQVEAGTYEARRGSTVVLDRTRAEPAGVELHVTPTASPADAARAAHAVPATLRRQGLQTPRLAQMDRPGRHGLRTAA